MSWPTDTPKALPADVIEAENRKLKEALSKEAIKPEDIASVLGVLWDSPTTLSKVNPENQETIKSSALKILAKPVGERTLGDRSILEFYERLFPLEATLQKQLVPTNKPSAIIQSLKNPDGTINFKELQRLGDLSPENIKEQFKTLNKWDLKEIMKAIDLLPDALRPKLKETMATVLDTMIANWFSIENIEDLTFIQNNWSPTLKKYLTETLKASEIVTIQKNIQEGKKYVLKNTNNTYTINALISETGTLPAWLDITKLNTLDTKTATADIQKKAEEMRQAGQGWNMDSIRTMIKWLEKLWGLGKLLALIFGAVFGISENGDKKEQWPEKAKTNLEKRQLLDKMTWKNDKYNLSSLFDAKTGKIVWDQTSKEFQEYLKDVYVLVGKELPKKEDEKLTYDSSLIDLVTRYEISLWITDPKEKAGRLDKAKVDLILSKLDPNGDLIKKPDAAPAAAVVPAAQEILKKEPHPLGERIVALEGKSYTEIKAILTSNPIPRKQVLELQKEFGFTVGNPDKSKRLDGDMGPWTVSAFLNKYPKGMIEGVPKPPPPAAQK